MSGGFDRQSVAPGFSGDPTRSLTPNGEFYYSPEIFELERRRIFHRHWVYLCHESQVPKAGDYLVGDIVGQSVAAIRGRDGVLRVFFNVCQHRAHQILKGSGNIQAMIRCPYHSWTYDLDGRLRHAPECEAVKDFDKGKIGLQAVRGESVGGFVFVNLDPSAPSLDESAPSFRRRLLAMAPEAARLKHARTQEFEIKANWKVVAENFLENYHSIYSGPAHAQLSTIIDQSSYGWEIDGKIVQFVGRGGAPDRLPYRANEKRTLTGREEGFLIVYLWPSVAFVMLPGADVVLVFLMTPTGPETTFEPLFYFTPDGSLDRGTNAAVDWFNIVLGPEDVEICESVQRGLHSLGYRAGRLMVDPACRAIWSEHFLHHFNSLNIGALEKGETPER